MIQKTKVTILISIFCAMISASSTIDANEYTHCSIASQQYSVSSLSSFTVPGIQKTSDLTILSNGSAGPMLEKPEENASNQDLGVFMRWKKVASATQYTLQVATDYNFSQNLYEKTFSDTLIVLWGLNGKTSFYWRVNATVTGGSGPGPWSLIRKFTTKETAPASPQHIAPSNNSIQQSSNVQFEWKEIVEANSYSLQVSFDRLFQDASTQTFVIADSTNKFKQSFTHTAALQPNKMYYWRVSATSNNGTGQWSQSWQLTTGANSEMKAQLLEPGNTSSNQPLTLTIKWKKFDGDVLYHAQIATSSGFEPQTIISNGDTITKDTLKNVSNLLNNTTYYWRVAILKGTAAGPWSDIWKFSTIAGNPQLVTPTLVAPKNGEKNHPDTVIFQWKKVANAQKYLVQVATTSEFTFTSLVLFDSIADTIGIGRNFQKGKTYYWHVKAKKGDLTSPWSETWNFTVESMPLTAPALKSPANAGPAISAATINFVWSRVIAATSYGLQIAMQPDFSKTSLVHEKNGLADTLYTAFNLTSDTKFYWRTKAINGKDTSLWSEVWSLTTLGGTQVPPKVVLSSPLDKSQKVTIPCLVVWGPATGATTYALQVAKSKDFSQQSIVTDVENIKTNDQFLKNIVGQTTYFWRVCAKNTTGTGPWSEVWSFTTDASTSIQESEKSPRDFVIYPTQNIYKHGDKTLTFSYKTSHTMHVSFVLYNALGVVVSHDTRIVTSNSSATDLKLSLTQRNALIPGAYVLRINAQNQQTHAQYTREYLLGIKE